MGTQSSIRPYRILLHIACALLFALPGAAQTPSISATAVPLVLPSVLVFDSAGNLYLAETGSHLIRKVDLFGHISTVAGSGIQGFSGDGGPATSAALDSPQGLALANGSLYIADTHNHRIRKLDLTTGILATIAGNGLPSFSGDNAPATNATLNLPTALAADNSGNLYLADTGNHRIRKIASATGVITTVAGSGIQGFSGDHASALAAAIDSPTGIALDAAGNLYLADTHNQRLRKVTASTGLITTLAGISLLGRSADNILASTSQLALPRGLTVDSSGNLYLTDSGNNRIRRIDASTGLITTITGNPTQNFSGDTGPAATATLDAPQAVVLSPTNLLTITDTGNQRVRQLASSLSVTTANPPSPSINTIAGLGNTLAGSLTLASPSTIAFGTGRLIATLATGTLASGSLTFLDAAATPSHPFSIVSTLAVAPLTANSAALSTASLPAGLHSITATYPGDLTHASARSTTFALTVTPAPTLTTLILTQNANQLTLTAQVASTTTGIPAGTLTLDDPSAGLTTIDTRKLDAAGAAIFLVAAPPTGTLSFSASYAGGPNFQSSTSIPAVFTVAPPPASTDFTLTATGGANQAILSGSPASFPFHLQVQGVALNSPILLAASGLPPYATASFSPTYLPPGNAANDFTLTIITIKTAALTPGTHAAGSLLAAALSAFLLPILWPVRRKFTLAAILPVALLSLIAFLGAGCGARINTGVNPASTQPKPYTIAVTGTTTSPAGATLTHTANVVLTVQ